MAVLQPEAHSLAYHRSGDNVPRTNKRFLFSIIKNTDDHNKTLLRAQALAAQEIKRQKEEIERKDRMKRAQEAASAASDRVRRSEWDDRPSTRRNDRKRERSWERRDHDDDVEPKRRRKRSRSTERTRSRRSHKREEKSSSSRRNRSYSRESDRTPSRSSQRRKEPSSHRSHRSSRTSDVKDSGKHKDHSIHVSRLSRSPRIREDHEKGTSTKSDPWADVMIDRDSFDREEELRQRLRLKNSTTPAVPIDEDDRSRPHRLKSTPQSPSPTLSPGPYLPPTLPESKMDRYFAESYDPRLDVTPLSIPTIPATGLINNAEFESWDRMLELVRLRREDREDRKLLEKLGLRKDKDKSGKKGSESVSKSSTSERWGRGGEDIMEIEYKKRGATREWDMGK